MALELASDLAYKFCVGVSIGLFHDAVRRLWKSHGDLDRGNPGERHDVCSVGGLALCGSTVEVFAVRDSEVL